MNPSYVLLLAFLIGVIGGLRTMTAPAVVAWAANRHWLNLDNSLLALIGSLGAVLVFTLGALGELVIDKLPSTPNRTRLLGLVGRSVLGGLSGGAVAVAGAAAVLLRIRALEPQHRPLVWRARAPDRGRRAVNRRELLQERGNGVGRHRRRDRSVTLARSTKQQRQSGA